MTLDKIYWENRYLQKDTGWDLGQVSPPIKAYIDQLDNTEINILIPGCGNAYEANYLLEKGFSNITLIDLSPTLIEQLKSNLNTNQSQSINIACGDFFALKGKFDLIIEQTFFVHYIRVKERIIARRWLNCLHQQESLWACSSIGILKTALRLEEVRWNMKNCFQPVFKYKKWSPVSIPYCLDKDRNCLLF